jgi:hypothetical protein
MDEYESLNVWSAIDSPPERFEECRATITPSRVLIVTAGNERHVWNADAWVKVEGRPLVRV